MNFEIESHSLFLVFVRISELVEKRLCLNILENVFFVGLKSLKRGENCFIGFFWWRWRGRWSLREEGIVQMGSMPLICIQLKYKDTYIKRQRQRKTERDRERQRETERESEREREREAEREREREIDKETNRF